VVTIGVNGSVTASDLVSPCPDGARCAWSGVVRWKGTYEKKGDRLVLAVAVEGAGAPAVALPTELTWDAKEDALLEAGDSCHYKRGTS
jgi:hypothetical protein